MAELRPKLHDVVTMMQCSPNKERVLVKPVEELGFFSQATLTDTQKIFEEFLFTIYNRAANDPMDYYLTSAFASFILQFKYFDGIMYRSFATKCRGHNLAFTAAFADQYIKPVKFRCYRVTEYNSPLNFTVKCLYQAKRMSKKRKIAWVPVTECPGHEITEKLWLAH